MKIIFLDIDGVLNQPNDKDLIEETISKNRLSLFEQLVNETDSYVVIISSRRCYKEDRDQLIRIFDNIYEKVFFLSERVLAKYRVDEIKMFLEKNKCDSFVILDDVDSKYTSDEYIGNHFIEIKDGFDEACYNKAITILNS